MSEQPRPTRSGTDLRQVRRLLGAAALMAAAVLAGCSRSADDRLAQAQALAARQDSAGALVAVKALLQQKPEMAEARLLLGRLLLERGQAAAAEAELQRALGLGLAPARVIPLVAEAMLRAGHDAALVARLGQQNLPDATAQARLKTALAEAQARLDQDTAARDSLAAALRAQPGHAPALRLQARLTAAGGDLPAALAQLQQLLAAQPGDAEAWVLLGHLQAHQQADPSQAQALASYRKALTLQPDHVGAHAALVSAHLARNDLDAARQQFVQMQQRLPRHPSTLQLEGELALAQGDLPRAQALFQQLLRAMPDQPQVLQSAAMVELRLNAPAQAEQLLTKAMAQVPGSAVLRRLAARAQLAQGQTARALTLLEPLAGDGSTDVDALALAAQARLMAGEAAAAAALFKRAAALRPADGRLRAASALLRLRDGDEAALRDLQRAAADSKDSGTDLALIATHLQRREWDAAMQAIDRLAAKQPDQPLALLLRGQVLQQQGRADAARAAFGQALARNPDHLPTLAALARLDLAANQGAAAQTRYEALLQRQPKLAPAHLALAELALRNGGGRGVAVERLQAGIQAVPDDLTLRLALIDLHLAGDRLREALDAAQAAAARWPEQPALLARLGRTQLRVGDGQQAAASFRRLVTLQPRAAAGHLGLAEAQLAQQDLASAERTLQQLLVIDPQNLPAQQLQAGLAMRQKQPAQALAVARRIQQQRPTLAAGWLLEGDVQAAQQRWPAAVAALRQALIRSDPQLAPARLHAVLLRNGQAAEASALAADWPRRHPQDLLFRHYLGDEAMGRRDLASAEVHYRAVLAVNPQQALARNNLAWVLLEQGKPGALAEAEQAVQLAPDQAQLRDTLARALAAAGRLKDALAMQQAALALAPDAPGLRLQLAKLQVQAGDRKSARAEYQRLAALGTRFAQHEEVSVALKSLGGR
jgi:putative PEP-CTERM system TPR-repeat lipoprotein